MYGYIYLTTNKVNGRKYIGKHSKSEFDKSYCGSGKILKQAIKLYGKENFICEVIDWAETVEELNQKETEWIAKHDAVNSGEYYNIANGGDGGIVWGETNPFYGKKHSEETKKTLKEKWDYDKHFSEETRRKMSKNRKGEGNAFYGRHHSEETKQKLREANSGENSLMWGKHLSEEQKKRISEAHKNRPMSEEQKNTYRKRLGNQSGSNNLNAKKVKVI